MKNLVKSLVLLMALAVSSRAFTAGKFSEANYYQSETLAYAERPSIENVDLIAKLKPELKITSFVRVSDNAKNMAAEICGTLTGVPGEFQIIRLTTDIASKNPANYHTVVGSTGKFCHLVTTYLGTIQAVVETYSPKLKTKAKME
ncbi:MAG: hypothetical protein HOE90_12485 [Bacteriovoracaceae bacterium]|jgi:hypothetical protein|nr:hypothetical protein [Bacteriovoracaceae bacterium]